MNQPPRVSAVVPTHRGGAPLQACLAALVVSSPPLHEIVVVVDQDENDVLTASRFPQVQILRTPRHGGPAAARNLGAREATGDILFFVDADVVVPVNLVARLAARLVASPDLCAVIGSYDTHPADPGFLSQYRNLLHHYVHQTSSPEASTFWSGCGGIWRETFLAVGGFDESYAAPAIEDIELGYRLRRAGYQIALDKDLQVCHLKHWSVLGLWRTELFARAIPWTVLILRDRRMPNDLNLQSRYVLSVALASAGLGLLLAALVVPAAGLLGLALLVGLFAANLPMFRFLARERSIRFALAAAPFHFVHYLLCALGFGLGVVRYLHQAIARACATKIVPQPGTDDALPRTTP